ncbi:MAG: LysR family transcriptional regulator [Pseudomonadota bacterium]
MADIHHSNIRRIDPTILMVFLALMRRRKGTLAARDLGLTQPAISHALKRLREVYGDPLFLRQSHGLEPTHMARELEPKIRDVVDRLAQTLSPPAQPDLSEATWELRLGAFDFELATILPELISRLRRRAPNVAIESFQIAHEPALEALLDGRIDILVGYFEGTKIERASLIRTPLYSERYVAIARKDHALLSEPFDLETFAEAEHLLVSATGFRKNLVDHALQLAGLSRSVKTVVPSLFSALSVLSQTDLIASVPERVAVQHGARFGLSYRELPIEGGRFDLHAVTRARDANSAMHQLTLHELKEAGRALMASGPAVGAFTDRQDRERIPG